MYSLRNTPLYFGKYGIVFSTGIVLYFLQYSGVFFMSYCGIFRRLWQYVFQTIAILKIKISQWQCLRSNYGFLNVEVWQGSVVLVYIWYNITLYFRQEMLSLCYNTFVFWQNTDVYLLQYGIVV